MKWYLKAIKQYADFNGRARRMEYWMFVLFNFLIALALGFTDMLIGTYDSGYGLGTLSSLYLLFALVPGIAVAFRRLHDVGKSGWWILIALIPFIGAIWLIVLYLTDSQPGSNEYGPNPKE